MYFEKNDRGRKGIWHTPEGKYQITRRPTADNKGMWKQKKNGGAWPQCASLSYIGNRYVAAYSMLVRTTFASP